MASRIVPFALSTLLLTLVACGNPPQKDEPPTTPTPTPSPTPPNGAPVTQAESYALDEDGTLSVAAADGVLANDTDPEGGSLTARLSVEPLHGTVVIDADGAFQYAPEADYNGSDAFAYEAVDDQDAATAGQVTLSIQAVNDAPVAVADAFAATEDTPLTVDAADGVLANDDDIDGDVLAATLVDAPEHGTITVNTDGAFSYVPELNFNGLDGFTYAAADAEASVVTAVELNVAPVDDKPLIAAAAFNGTEDTMLSVGAPGILVQTVDVDGEAVTAVLDTAPASGTLALNANGSFTYMPDANVNGDVTFTFKVTDGVSMVGPETVTIDLAAVNDAPAAVADNFAATEDTTLTIAAAAGVLMNDFDVDGDTFTASLITAPAHGSLTFGADGAFEYVPEANFNGNDTFVYRLTDGALDSGNATATIAVAPVNDRPISIGDAYTLDEDVALTVAAATGLLANDADIENDPLTAVLVDPPQHGTIALNADGSFTYTPDANYFGADVFSYSASDGDLVSFPDVVTLSITSVNDAPIAAADDVYVLEHIGGTISLDQLKANDTDVDGDAFTLAIKSDPSHGTLVDEGNGTLTYDPTDGYLGSDAFQYALSDGLLESTPVSVTVHVLDKPDALWAKAVAGDQLDIVEDIAVRSDGTLIAVGSFEGPSATIAGQVVNSATDPTGFAVALSPAGAVQWIYTSQYEFNTVATAPDGTTYIAAYYPSAVVRLDNDGNELWTVSADLNGRPESLATLSDSSVIVGQLGGHTELQRFDTNGTELWAKSLYHVNVARANGLTADGMSFVMVGRAFNGAVFGKNEPNETQLLEYRNYDTSPFLALYDGADGSLQWVRHAPAPTGAPLVGNYLIAQDSDTRAVTKTATSFVITGALQGTAEFGWDTATPTTLQTPPLSYSFIERIFVASYTTGGDFEWALTVDTGSSLGNDIVTRADGSLLVWGSQNGSTTFASATRSFKLAGYPNSEDCMFLLELAADGDLIWAWGAASGYRGATSLVQLSDGSLAASGYFRDDGLEVAPGEPSAITLSAAGTSPRRDGAILRFDTW